MIMKITVFFYKINSNNQELIHYIHCFGSILYNESIMKEFL